MMDHHRRIQKYPSTHTDHAKQNHMHCQKLLLENLKLPSFAARAGHIASNIPTPKSCVPWHAPAILDVIFLTMYTIGGIVILLYLASALAFSSRRRHEYFYKLATSTAVKKQFQLITIYLNVQEVYLKQSSVFCRKNLETGCTNKKLGTFCCIRKIPV